MPQRHQSNGPTTTPPHSGAPRQSPIALPDFARRVVVAVLIVVLLLGTAYLLWRGLDVLFEAFAGVLFGLFLSALADWLHQRSGLSYKRSLATVIIALLLAAAGVGWFLAHRISTEFAELMHKLPQSWEQARAYLAQTGPGQYLLGQMENSDGPAAMIFGINKASGLFAGLTSFLTAALVIFFVGGFGAAEPDQYKDGLFHLVPPQHRRRAGEAVDAIVFNLRAWLLGQMLLMLILWVTTTIGLSLMGIPLALVLGLITGLLELIPYLGAWISAVPAALIALTISPTHLLMVLGLYLGLHLLEGYVIYPLILRRAVHMPPALTLVSQVLLGKLMGLLGLFVAAPLTVVVVVLVKMLYVEDTLGDQAVEVPGEPGNEPAANRMAGQT